MIDDRYEVRAELGRGSGGVVYRCRDRELDRDVAVKVLLHLTDLGRERFEREVQAAAALLHPGIVRIYAHGIVRGHCYAVYELIEGALPLRDIFLGGEPLENAALVARIAEAVGAAHEHGLVHRDLKAENVIVDPQGSPRLLDFGVAVATGDSRLTATGAVVGTPYVMAPEQLEPHPAVRPPTDVWALGVMLYEALSGVRPFQGESLPALVSQIQCAAPPAPSRLRAGIPPSMDAVCAKALQRTPDARYPDGAAFAAAVEVALTDPRRARSLHWVALLGSLCLVGLVSLWVARAPVVEEGAEPLPSPIVTKAAPPPKRAAPAGLAAIGGAWKTTHLVRSPYRRFGAPTHAAVYAGQGSIAVAVSQSVVLWNPTTDERRTLGRHAGGALCLAYVPSSGAIVSGGRDGRIRSWGTETPVRIAQGQPVVALAVHGERGLLASYGEGKLNLWSIREGSRLLRSVNVAGPVRALSFSRAGDRLLVGFLQRTTFVIQKAGPSRVLTGQPPVVYDTLSLEPLHLLPTSSHAACFVEGGLLVAYQQRLALLSSAFKEVAGFAPFETEAPIDALVADAAGRVVAFRTQPVWKIEEPIRLAGVWRLSLHPRGEPTLLGLDSISRQLVLSPEGSAVMTVGLRPGLRLLTGASPLGLSPLRELAVAPGGERVVGRNESGSVWEVDVTRDPAQLRPLEKGNADSETAVAKGMLMWPFDLPLLQIGSATLRLRRDRSLGVPIVRRGSTTEGIQARRPPGRVTGFLVAEGRTLVQHDDGPSAVRRRRGVLPANLSAWAQAADGRVAWGVTPTGLWRLAFPGRTTRVRDRRGEAADVWCDARGERALLLEARSAGKAALIYATAAETRELATVPGRAFLALNRDGTRCVVAAGADVELRSLPGYERIAWVRLVPDDRPTAVAFAPAGASVCLATEQLSFARLRIDPTLKTD